MVGIPRQDNILYAVEKELLSFWPRYCKTPWNIMSFYIFGGKSLVKLLENRCHDLKRVLR